MTEPGKNLTIFPDRALAGLANGDLLSQVLARMRMTGDRIFSSMLLPFAQLDMSARAAHAYAVMEGVVKIAGDEADASEIRSGELLLLPRGPGSLRISALDQPANVVVCHFWFDPASQPDLLLTLPAMIHLRQAETCDWLPNIMQFLLHEADNDEAGSALMVSRMIDLVVVRALRAWVHHGHASNWLGGLADKRIARALKAIHEQSPRGLTIDGLAAVSGMSRSNFCERFNALVGKSPLRYRNEWRLSVARDMLAKGDARVGEVRRSVGYESEAAFSRAYKAYFGHAPREAKPSITPAE
ncbi:helix-turn-helix transcriptional regulator [Burkholderia cepacia]|uniref:helix-turn-helix transcriptional regulator n=1 Tax=Burkholderia cepacia TaxID=292 RepID=UPI001CF4245E|nr:AraC family transcriptional regulator [Burkholderia cepacia]MCA8060003.1 AraC family transcriptional regulator [Burkholderia cepacia]MCA8137259.1 AraC family transcriptional regulator [Burkholderia cepacia]